MEFASGKLNESVAALRSSGGAFSVAVGDNVVLEERVADSRRATFEAVAEPKGDFLDGLGVYVETRINVLGKPPATFEPGNSLALLGPIDPRQTLVRVEQLGRLLDIGVKRTAAEFLSLVEKWKAGDSSSAAAIDRVFSGWNLKRDHRPAFAAFYDDVKDLADADDWAEELRAQLGLGHLDTEDGPVLVGQMRYAVSEVLNEPGAYSANFAAPTILDSGPSAYFFPSPSPPPGQSPTYGRTVHLADQDRMVSEILHRRITYQPRHLHKVFLLTKRMPEPALDRLKSLRENHLRRLRKKLSRPTFGESILPVSGAAL